MKKFATMLGAFFVAWIVIGLCIYWPERAVGQFYQVVSE